MQQTHEKLRQSFEKTSTSATSSISPRANLSVDEFLRPGGYDHPRSHTHLFISNNMCVNIHDDQDFKLACVQTSFDICLGDCVGVGGQKEFLGEFEGSRNEGPGGAIGGFGGIGAESKCQDGGN